MYKLMLAAVGMLLLLQTAARAQTIHGVVVEDGTTTPIAAVLVELVAAGGEEVVRTETSGSGVFVLRPRRSGRFILRLRHLGFTPLDSDTLVVNRGEMLEVEVHLSRTAIAIDPLVVTTRRSARLAGFYERQQRSGIGRYLTRAEIERRPGTSVTELLRTMPGVTLVPVSLGMGSSAGNLITMRGGSGRCLPTVYLDGVVVKQYAESTIDDFLKGDMLEGVEVYTSFAAAPSPLHALDGCGVVAFWTRPAQPGTLSWKKMAAGAVGFLLMVTLARPFNR